jgi:hypothetical protein
MKSYIVIVIAALATAVAGTSMPNAVPDAEPEPQLEARRVCFRPSRCSIFWSGKCEGYCRQYRFSHMEKGPCGGFAKRCCCRR